MQIVKSLHASLLHRAFSYQEKHYFTATTVWGFNLTTGEPVMEQALWTSLADLLASGEIFDTGMPKAVAEFMVRGKCFAPNGNAVSAINVDVNFSGIDKSVSVYGDRYWITSLGAGVGVTDPETFTEMPLTYAKAFGGKDYPKNPVGIGIEQVDVNGELMQPLPNIENPQQLIGSPKERPEPAGLSRIDQMAEQRTLRGGTYDQKYIDTRMPAFPDDLNLETFNDAPLDQWLPTFPKGDESFSISNMHPDMPLIRGQLPAVRGRAFVEHKVDGELVFKEIDTRLDTVHFLPNENLGIVMHRGTIEVAEDDAADINKIIIAHENIADDKRTANHYEEQMGFRTDREESYKYLLNTAPLIPIGCKCGFETITEQYNESTGRLMDENIRNFADEKVAELEEQKEQALQQQVDEIKKAGGDASALEAQLAKSKALEKQEPVLSEDEKKIKAITDKLAPKKGDGALDMSNIDLKAIDELKIAIDEIAQRQKKEAEDRLREQIAEADKSGNESDAKRLQVLLDNMILPPILPRNNPKVVQAQFDAMDEGLEKEIHKLQSMGALDKDVIEKLEATVAENKAKTDEILDKAVNNYRIGAHFIAESRSPHEGREEQIKKDFIESKASGAKLAGGDYAFVDLSGMDLSGVDLSGAYMEYVNLSGTNLSSANLEGAILAHATLSNTNLTGANLKDANLGACDIKDSNLSDANTEKTIIQKSVIENTKFTNCDFSERLDAFLDVSLDSVDFTGSNLHKCAFIDIAFENCKFTSSNLSEATFINPILTECNFDSGNLSGTNFIFAKGNRSSYRNAIMNNVRFVGNAELNHADFSGCELSESNLRDAELDNALFTNAVLNKTDFGSSTLRHANFDKAVGHEVQFSKSILEHASLNSVDFYEGSMYKAKISSASFVGASLYNVNFMGCFHSSETNFTGADLKRTIFKDWRP